MVKQPFHKSRVFSVDMETVDKTAIADVEDCADAEQEKKENI